MYYPNVPVTQPQPTIADPAFQAILVSLHGELELTDMDQYIASIEPMSENTDFDSNLLL